MVVNIIHWLAIAGQFGNIALGIVPAKYQPYVAGALGVFQYVTHLLDPKAPSIGAGVSQWTK